MAEATRHPGLDGVLERIRAAERESEREPESVQLVAVSKQQPEDRVQAALDAGQRVFGENRVQEARQRWESRRADLPDLELHLVGPLQGNKARQAVEMFDCIQSLDRAKLAARIADAMRETGRTPRLFVQVNTGGEPQKSGVLPEEAEAFIDSCRGEYKLAIDGLMAIPPVDEEPSPHFGLLAQIARRSGVECLSMGMSGDFECAVAFGATHVRVGSAVFGQRPGGAN